MVGTLLKDMKQKPFVVYEPGVSQETRRCSACDYGHSRTTPVPTETRHQNIRTSLVLHQNAKQHDETPS
jgi:hypothetical protein